jgi:hypothetical protein
MIRASALAAALLATATTLAAQEAPAPAAPVRVVIHVVDPANRRGIEGMEVRIAGLAAVTSDRRGDVVFAAVPAGSHALEFSHRVYGTGSATLAVSGPGTAEFELPVPRREAALDPLQVTARRMTAMERNDRTGGRRQNVLTREDIEARSASARNVGDLVRTFPSLQVSEIQYPGSRTVKEVCIIDRASTRNAPLVTRDAMQQREKDNRRDATMTPRPVARDAFHGATQDEQCEGVAVAIDDRMMAGQPGELLRGLSLNEIESVSYLRPSEAASRFGTAGGNGVILVYTRGNGPTVRSQ